MTTHPFDLTIAHPTWLPCLEKGLAALDPAYLSSLTKSNDWLPNPKNIFSAFSLPLTQVNYVLFGESPYPRAASANGYAFWDASVQKLWSTSGLSKEVNRATSLRNIIKMLLLCENLLTPLDTSQEAIAKVNKDQLIQTNDAFFNNLLNHGFLLLNATLVLQPSSPKQDAKAWHPFMKEVLTCLLNQQSNAKLILFGKIANIINGLVDKDRVALEVEHPYNLSFINNIQVQSFFKPLHLLRKNT